MSSLKDNLLMEKQSLKLTVEQSGFSFVNFLRSFPKGKKILLLVLAIGIIPAIVLARVGSQLLVERQLAGDVVTAHTAYVAPNEVAVGAVKVLQNNSSYSAYAQITNENLDLAAPQVSYRFDFLSSTGQVVASSNGTTYLLPNQQKYLVVPRIESAQLIASAELSLDSIKWQKRLTLPEVSLRAVAPFISNEVNPLTLVAEGAVVNNSAYELAAVHLVFLLYDQQNQIVAVSQRDEFNVPAFGRRAYKQTWPDLYADGIARTVVIAETNSLDNDNLLSGGGSQ